MGTQILNIVRFWAPLVGTQILNIVRFWAPLARSRAKTHASRRATHMHVQPNIDAQRRALADHGAMQSDSRYAGAIAHTMEHTTYTYTRKLLIHDMLSHSFFANYQCTLACMQGAWCTAGMARHRHCQSRYELGHSIRQAHSIYKSIVSDKCARDVYS